MSQGIPVGSAGASASAGRSRGRGGRGGRGWWRGRGRGWGRGRGQYSGGRGSMSHSSESGERIEKRAYSSVLPRLPKPQIIMISSFTRPLDLTATSSSPVFPR